LYILYVEDDPFDVELTIRELARSGPLHRVESVGTIQTARDLLNVASERFDLVMIDLNLPDGNGVDLLAYIRSRGLPLATVVVTGAGDEEMAAALLKAGAEDYIVKEDDYLAHLAPMLESALQRYRSERMRRSRILNVIYADTSHEDVELARMHLNRFAPHIRIDPVASAAEIYSRLDAGCLAGACDALVVEYRLPDANALDLLKELYQIRGLKIPVLVVTGSGSEDVAAQALKLGAADYLVKTQGYVFRLPSAIENAVTRAQLAFEQAALRESEARFRRLAENAPDLIFRILLKPELRFDYISPAAVHMIGYTPEEHYAEPGLLFRLVHPDDAGLLDRISSGNARPGEPLLMRWLRKDGRMIWVEQRISYVYNGEGGIIAVEGIARDVTGQRETEDEMQRQLQRLASLRSIDQAISNSFDLNLVLVVLIEKVISELKVDAASILLYNQVTQMLEHSSGSGYRSRLVDRMGLRIGEAYAGLSMYERRLIQFPADDLPEPSRDTARLIAEEGFVSGVCAPLITKGEVKGVLQVFSRGMLKTETGWLGFLEVLSSQAAIAIDNAEMFQQMQRSNQDLKLAYDAMLDGWVRALDLRMREKHEHNRSVTRRVLELAEVMRVDPEDLGPIRRGALLHDIGQLAIPDSILLKPGPLSEEDWQTMRQHPRLALEMLAPIPSMDKALEIPYSHHEKWNGSGYPRGLKGDRIPLAARLFAVVDVWDAMTSDKPFRPALTREEALAYIREQSGQHFDPAVVEGFLKMMG
jgi:PAS domain S-box-containing protein